MWVEQLDVRGFRRLRGTFRLDKGLTLVVGDNEAGKSSLHEALIRALFGFARAERTRRGGTSIKDNCAPWLENEFAINALVHEVKGRSLRVEWDFEAHQATLLEADTGADLSQQIRLKRDDVRLGPYLVGLTLDDFREVCCLDQAAINAVERTENLVLALQQSIESTARDLGVESAIALLNERLREAGVHVGTLSPSPSGTMANLMRERDVLRAELARVERVRQEIAHRAIDLSHTQERISLLRHDVDGIDQRVMRIEADRLQRVCGRAQQLQAESQNTVGVLLAIPNAHLTRIAELSATLRAVQQSIDRLEDEQRKAAALSETLGRTRDELARSAPSMPFKADIDLTLEPEVRRLLGQRDRVIDDRARIEIPQVPTLDLRLERYRSQRAHLLELQRVAAAPKWDASRLVAAAAVAVISIILGTIVHPIYFAGLVPAVVIAAIARTGQAGATRFAAAIAEFGATSTEVLDERVREEERRITTAATLANERKRLLDAADQSLSLVEEELSTVLLRAGVPPTGTVVDRAGRYLEVCRNYIEQARLQLRLEALDADIATARRPGEDLKRKRQEELDLGAHLRAEYALIGINSADLSEAAAELQKRIDEAARVERQQTRAAAAADALTGLLGNQTPESLAIQARQAVEAYNDHIRRHGTWAESDETRESLLPRREILTRDIQLLERKEAELQTLIATQESELSDVPALKERIALLQDRVARIEHVSAAVALARQALQEAAKETHRKFAPYLNAALQRHLPRITDGRYANAAVDEDLQIRVQAPETGKFVSVDVLSRGTQDQIYFIQRLEIVRLLDPTTGEAPLLLDDAFTRFDAKRLRLAFGILAEVASERQVVLFSEDEGMVSVAEGLGIRCAVVRLPAPAGRNAVPGSVIESDVSKAG